MVVNKNKTSKNFFKTRTESRTKTAGRRIRTGIGIKVSVEKNTF